MPKEMLPIIDRPIIHFVVQEAIDSGIEDIIIITGRGKRAIEDYFDDTPALENYLIAHGKNEDLNLLTEISNFKDIHYIRQKEPRGLGDAILLAEKHIGDEPFAVLLGDDIVNNSTPCTKQLMDSYESLEKSIIAVETVPWEKVEKYGIVQVSIVDPPLYKIQKIVEKPQREDAPSNIGAIGRYVFNSDIFDCIRKTKIGFGGEVQLTDAITNLIDFQEVYAYAFQGRRYDAGDKIGYIQAVIDSGLSHPETKGAIRDYIISLQIDNFNDV